MNVKFWLFYLILFVLLIITNNFEIKLACLLLFSLQFLQLRRLSYQIVFLILITVYLFAYIFTPYWQTFGIPAIGFPLLKYIVLVILTVLGYFWVQAVGGEIRFPRINSSPVLLSLLSIVIFIVNSRSLAADIAWRGDEDFHINTVLNLVGYLQFYARQWNIYIFENIFFWIFIVINGMGFILILLGKLYNQLTWSNWFRPIGKFMVLLSLPILAVVVFGDIPFQKQEILTLDSIVRYPFLQKWISLFFVITNPYQDVRLYRLVPFLSSMFISWYLYITFDKKIKHKFLSFSLTLAFSTIPLLLYYNSLLYLEMPIVFLALICIGNLPILMGDEQSKLKTQPVWYALLILPFLKETSLILIIFILCLRLVWQIKKIKQVYKLSHILIQEIKLSFWVMLPGIIFLGFRQFFSFIGRLRYIFNLPYIFETYSYITISKALTIQTGFLFILGLFAIVYSLRSKKSRFSFGILLFIFIGVFYFFLGYQYEGFVRSGKALLLIGYSRWNLFLIPMLFVIVFRFLITIKRPVQIVACLIIILFNVLLFPFKKDGVRLQSWGILTDEFAEYTYPYDAAIKYISYNKNIKKLIHIGQFSPYGGFSFYFHKYHIEPKVIEYPFGQQRLSIKEEKLRLSTFMNDLLGQRLEPELLTADTILYHSMNNLDLDGKYAYGGRYYLRRRIQNSLHSLYIFTIQRS